ncbi:MAG: hypothetical protein AB1801_08435 [Chloroflexota bacterium]
MKRNDLWFFWPALAGAMLLVLGLLSWTARPAQAQCGSQASSCKSCHETQGQLPVNNNGDWHTAHAFGDFCEFCHAGNVQAKAKDEAHLGLVAPLDDVKAGCQSCHPTDYMDKAQVFASTLGVEVGAGAGGGDNSSGGNDSDSDGGNATGSTSVGAPLGGEEIDFNLLYAEATTQPLVSNWGNVILILMILGAGGAFFVTAWSWEGWGQNVGRWIEANVAPIPQAVAAVNARGDSRAILSKVLAGENVSAVLAQKPELLELLPKLLDCQPETLAALDRLLENPERGSEILAAISKVDTEVVTALRQIGARDRNLLLALLKEI